VRRGAAILVSSLGLVAGAPTARGDGEVEVREGGALLEPGPRLELDPVLPPLLQGLGATEEADRAELRIGADTRVLLEGVRWIHDDAAALPHVDLPARGWRAAVRLSHDLGFARVEAGASLNEVDSRFGSGRYVDLGLSIRRTFRLSRWMTAWISLGVGRRRWLGAGQPPAGESDATEVMLRVGTTFR
jgi:hypothetical protein